MADQCIRQGWVCFRLVPFVFNLALACVYRNRRPFTLLESRRRFAFQFHKARAPDISLCAISGLGLDNSLSTHVIELLCSVSIDCFVVGRVVGRRINCYIYLYKTMTCGSLWRRGSPPNSGLLKFTKMSLYALSPIKTGTLLYLTSLVFTSILLQNGYQYGYQSSSWQDKNF